MVNHTDRQTDRHYIFKFFYLLLFHARGYTSPKRGSLHQVNHSSVETEYPVEENVQQAFGGENPLP